MPCERLLRSVARDYTMFYTTSGSVVLDAHLQLTADNFRWSASVDYLCMVMCGSGGSGPVANTDASGQGEMNTSRGHSGGTLSAGLDEMLVELYFFLVS